MIELHDGELVLRPWREEDADAVYEACQDVEIQHWIPAIPRPYTLEHARAFVSGEADPRPHSFAISGRASSARISSTPTGGGATR